MGMCCGFLFAFYGEIVPVSPSFVDDDLDVVLSSNSKCGRDDTKFASSTIFFHCSQQAKEGIPEFLHESSDCQYLFTWYTSAVCPLA